jgi:hypothetical protein
METKEEKIYDYAQRVMQVKFVELIHESFAGLSLPNNDFGKDVANAVDKLLGEVTQIGDLKGTGLGMTRTGFPSGRKIEDE